MTPLEDALRARIARAGPIPVAAFMEAANTDPAHGYYRRRDPLGQAGDFVTAPEISQVFGELVGAWCAVCWQALGAPPRLVLAELGPGRGTLLADALRAAARLPGFAAALELHLVETGPALEAAQRAALGRFAPRWHRSFAGLPDGPLVLVANEFFDALPVAQYVRRGGRWRERRVGTDPATGRLRFVDGPPAAPPGAPEDPVPDGAVWETSPAGLALARAVARRLAAGGGYALIVDYGHARGGFGESLQAVRRHAPAPVLEAPGAADLSAHVDFAALAGAARRAGAAVHGPAPQGAFLRRLGLEARLGALAAGADAAGRAALRAAARRLAAPEGMGVLFKALALAGPRQPAPAGFES